MKNIIPIIKKIAREDKQEVIRSTAKDLLEDFKEFSQEEED